MVYRKPLKRLNYGELTCDTSLKRGANEILQSPERASYVVLNFDEGIQTDKIVMTPRPAVWLRQSPVMLRVRTMYRPKP